MPSLFRIDLPDAATTASLGSALARALPRTCVIWLRGDLGAGKTTLARGAIQHFQPGARVKSPTYSLIETYEIGDLTLHHLDLYRLRDASELESLGIRDLEGDVMLIEWPEHGGEATPAADLQLSLAHTATGQRTLEAVAPSERGSWVLHQLRQFLQADGYKPAADDGFA